MPSTQSDGVQAAVVSTFTDMIYLPIETSGEGDINAHSRVQMALGEAKLKAQGEFDRVVGTLTHTLAEIKAYVASHRELSSPIQKIAHVKGVVGKAANFVVHVDGLMKADKAFQAARKSAKAEAVAAK
jgi:ClpP class serine protease